MKEFELDPEEKEILEAFDCGELKPVADRDHEIARHREYARNTLRKDRRVNIRISSKDLGDLQALAVEHGIPYQTLMSSILHRYVNGNLVDRNRAGSTS